MPNEGFTHSNKDLKRSDDLVKSSRELLARARRNIMRAQDVIGSIAWAEQATVPSIEEKKFKIRYFSFEDLLENPCLLGQLISLYQEDFSPEPWNAPWSKEQILKKLKEELMGENQERFKPYILLATNKKEEDEKEEVTGAACVYHIDSSTGLRWINPNYYAKPGPSQSNREWAKEREDFDKDLRDKIIKKEGHLPPYLAIVSELFTKRGSRGGGHVAFELMKYMTRIEMEMEINGVRIEGFLARTLDKADGESKARYPMATIMVNHLGMERIKELEYLPNPNAIYGIYYGNVKTVAGLLLSDKLNEYLRSTLIGLFNQMTNFVG